MQAHCHSAGCCGRCCRFNKAHTDVISTRTQTERQHKRKNCYRHSQDLERSQLSNKRWDRATQLVEVEVSVDFTKHTPLLLAHEYNQRDSAKERIIIVTDKNWSAVNCPINVGIVPLSWLLWRYLLFSQSTNCSCQHTNTNR